MFNMKATGIDRQFAIFVIKISLFDIGNQIDSFIPHASPT